MAEKKKVAICGFAPSWKLAPFDDASVKIWGLNELWKYLPRWDAWWEVHDDETLGVSKRDLTEGEQKRHLEWLKKDHGPGRPIYMQPQFCDGRFPNAVPLDIGALATAKAGRYFTSSIAMMVKKAIDDGYEWIGIYGIDLASDVEYLDQRPCAEYYIGIAEGRGIDVYLAPTSAICKAGHVYAFEKPVLAGNPVVDAARVAKKKLEEQHHQKLAELNTLDGAIQAHDSFLKMHEYKARGVDLMTAVQ